MREEDCQDQLQSNGFKRNKLQGLWGVELGWGKGRAENAEKRESL